MALSAAEIETAIKVITGGAQEYELNGRHYVFADLKDLEDMRQKALAAERAANGTMFQRVRFGTVGR